jgi:phenylacetate-coenzyme A ligase PaaK-like adenylate-forming protein
VLDRLTRLRRDVIPALKAARELEAHDQLDRGAYDALGRGRLLALVRHAATHSPYYREALSGIGLDDDLDMRALPTLDKTTMLENWDAVVTDPRLRLADVERVLEASTSDALHLGRYRTMASGGTTGRRGVFVYSTEDWRQVLGGVVRWTSDYIGAPPRLPRRVKQATVLAGSPQHMTARMARSLDVGVHRFLRIDARAPIEEMVPQLNAFQPEALSGYASLVTLLADEQLAGRLTISPRLVSTSSEVRTAEMQARIVAAWGSPSFDGYASTETGMLASECDRHTGMHVFEDLVHIEVVDDAGNAVPDGTAGSRVLITNLINHTQPLIRFELTDLVTIAPERCSCGRPSKLLAALDGRTDDVLAFPAAAGGTVSVHPLVLRSPLAKVAELRQYKIVHDDDGLFVEAVLAPGAGQATCAEIAAKLRDALETAGAAGVRVDVTQVAAIERHAGSGKAKLVESRAGSRGAAAR